MSDQVEQKLKPGMDAEVVFNSAFLTGIKPKQHLHVSDWADQYRFLTSKTSSEPGPWRTARTPYLKEVMDELGHLSKAQKVVFKKSSQVGGTEAGNNWIAYTIDEDPATMMVVWPSLPDVKKNSKLRIRPLLEETPKLRGKIYTEKQKSQDNTTLYKDFPGGALILTGANSASGLRSVPAKKAFLDEIDGYPSDVENEGDPIELVLTRSQNFPKRKTFLCSTPTLKGTSKIEKEYDLSDQRKYYVPCPHCKKKQVLKFDNLSWDSEIDEDQGGKEVVKYAAYFCEHCGEEIKEHFKTWMLATENGAEWIKHNPKSNVAGFHINGLYSPLGWLSWVQLCQQYVDAKNSKNQDKMKAFVNTKLGESYEEVGEKPEKDHLFNRREDYQVGSCPSGVLFLTCAVDIQKDRLEAEVHGWGRRRERWVIDRQVIEGGPNDDNSWDELEDYIGGLFPHEEGHDLPISFCAIDSGYEAQKVYNFCRRFSPKKVAPIKGDENLKQTISTPRKIDVKISGKTFRRGLSLWRVGVSIIKSELYGDLKQKIDDEVEFYPDGFVHFPEFDYEYFEQLISEERRIKTNSKGYSVQEWHKIRERNETLDLFVYNRAAASIFGMDRWKDAQWEKIKNKVHIAKRIKRSENVEEGLVKKKSSKQKRKKSKTGFWS